MLIHLDWKFWAIASALFVLIRLRPALPLTTWFGILNLAALGILLGWNGLALIAGFSLALWAALTIAQRSENRLHSNVLPYVVVAAFVGIVFMGHKVLFEMVGSTAAAGTVPRLSAELLQLVAFSYIALRAWDATESVRQGQPVLEPVALSGYLAPFFMMPAGPINVYAQHTDMDRQAETTPSWSWFLDGVELIVRGLFIKSCLAEGLRLFIVGVNGQWPTSDFLYSALMFVFILFDFWGYSLVALGVGMLLGVPTPVNFDQPLRSQSLTEFWNRWHMSLGDFVRRLIYFPLQLSLLRRTDGEHFYLVNTLSLIVAFAFVGIWHRFTLPFLIWGVLFGIILSIEKVVRDRLAGTIFDHVWARRAAVVLGPLYVNVVVIAMLHLTVMTQLVGGRP